MEVKLPMFAVRLKELREESGLKQTEVAAMLGCSERNYQRIEAGGSNVPALTLIKLADYFQVTVDYLLGRSDKRK